MARKVCKKIDISVFRQVGLGHMRFLHEESTMLPVQGSLGAFCKFQQNVCKSVDAGFSVF